MSTRSVVLASASPRRAELLRQVGLTFRVRPTRVDETPRSGEAPADLAERLARAKALAIGDLAPPALVIAADTIVVVEGDILPKPSDRTDSRRMLSRLAGRSHEVITALAIRPIPEETITCDRVISRVVFAPLSEQEIDWYVATGEGADKAGSYALQGVGALIITAIEGSYTNVIGLPLERLYPHLRRFVLLPQRGRAPRGPRSKHARLAARRHQT